MSENAANTNKPLITRREFNQTVALGASAGIATLGINTHAAPPRQFRLWATSDAHVGTDMRRDRESLAEAIAQSEGRGPGPGFEWDMALHLGDFSGNQGAPKDEEGELVVKQFGALQDHAREQFYGLAGNHDATFENEDTQWWFRKWIDPTGEQTEHSGVDPKNRPYPVEGTWERYSVQVGNIRFLMMSDRNDVGPPVGRGERGGYPAGAVTSETFAWWKDQVANHADDILISAHHHMLKETTVASGEYEGFEKDEDGNWKSHYHGYYPKGGPKGASYLYWLDDKPDAQAFEGYLAAHPGATDFWLGAHTHTNPADRKGGRSHIETKWGTHFANVSALAKHHAHITTLPMSRLFTFTEGSSEVRVQCYLHTDQFAPLGWYEPAERVLELGKTFRMG